MESLGKCGIEIKTASSGILHASLQQLHSDIKDDDVMQVRS